ncbi:MAG: AraC family transcriptional regulator, partial [Clostridia bacterium]
MQESFWGSNDDTPFSKRYRMSLIIHKKHNNILYHWHEVFEIYHVLDGELTLRCDGNEYRLKKGDTYFVNWCIPHQDKNHSDNAIVINCRIDDKLLGSVEKDLKKMNLQKVFFENDLEFINLFSELHGLYKKNDSSSEIKKNILFLKMFLKIINENTHNDIPKKEDNKNFVIFKEIFVYLKNHINENISLDKLSNEIGMHKNYLCKVFKEVTGHSIVTYFNIIRAHKAISMMKSNISLSEISDSLVCS